MNNTPTDLPVREMARRLGLAPSMVIKLRDAGMPMHCEVAAAQWRTEHVAPRPGTAKPGATATGTATPTKYAPWRARRERALALQAEADLEKQARRLVHGREVYQKMALRLVAAREVLRTCSDRLAPVVANETDIGRCALLIDTEMTRVEAELRGLAEDLKPGEIAIDLQELMRDE